jgi:uncharacterized repeat protein (TIGR03803 family)
MRTLRFLAYAAALGASLSVPRADAQSSFTTLYTFETSVSGGLPNGIVGADRVLYGTTGYGGAYGAGTVFELRPPAAADGTWSETTLYSFTGQNGDGASPLASPVGDAGGALYGTTGGGGAYGFGTVFKLQPPAAAGGNWSETVLYSFTGQNGDGSSPSASPVLGPGGAIYGTTYFGGAHGFGTIFDLQPPAAAGGGWNERVLYSFTGDFGDGANPLGLTMSAEGVLYGGTLDDFGGHAGTIFELRPPGPSGAAWTETVVHHFTGGGDGCYPYAPPVVAADGVLYGSTFGTIMTPIGYPGVFGLGVVFALTPPAAPGGKWADAALADLGEGEGWGPDSTLVARDGTIYGTASTRWGGVAFELIQPAVAGGPWTKVVLHSFTDGSAPSGGLAVGENGTLYGVTINPAQPTVGGTVYEIRP